MGIRGLTGFLEKKLFLFKHRALSDYKGNVIIDGNNILYFLYYDFKLPQRGGGDYDDFAEEIRSFLKYLQYCGLCPYVVFDGANDKDGLKLKKQMLSFSEEVLASIHLAAGGDGGGRDVMPVQSRETFQAVLDEFHVKHATTDYEGDAEIAVLAREWGCPVMTRDSDFFVYDLPGGVIVPTPGLIKSIKHDPTAIRNKEIKVYLINDLYEKFPRFRVKPVALFASLFGSNFLTTDDLRPFFASQRLAAPHHPDTKEKLMQWFNKFDGYEAVYQKIKTPLSGNTLLALEQSVKNYTKIETQTTNLGSYFTDNDRTSDFRTFANRTVPDWFLDCLRRGQIESVTRDALVTRRVFLGRQVEVRTEPSAHRCALPIRQVLYGMLLHYDAANKAPGSADHPQIKEIDRVEDRVESCFIDPVFELSNGKPVLALDAIPGAPPEERLAFLCDTLEVDPGLIESLPDVFKLPYSAIVYWARSARPQVGFPHACALLMCVMRNSATELLKSVESETTSDENRCQQLAKRFKEQAQCQVGDVGGEEDFEPAVIHAFSQFQACFQAVTALNVLLFCPLPPVSPAAVFNGTFLGKFYSKLSRHPRPDQCIREFMETADPAIGGCFNLLKNRLLEALPGLQL